MYIHIYRERERDNINIYMYTYTNIHIKKTVYIPLRMCYSFVWSYIHLLHLDHPVHILFPAHTWNMLFGQRLRRRCCTATRAIFENLEHVF